MKAKINNILMELGDLERQVRFLQVQAGDKHDRLLVIDNIRQIQESVTEIKFEIERKEKDYAKPHAN